MNEEKKELVIAMAKAVALAPGMGFAYIDEEGSVVLNLPLMADALIKEGYRKMTNEERIEEVAEVLAKQEGWLSLRHPSPKTQAELRARAEEMLVEK